MPNAMHLSPMPKAGGGKVRLLVTALSLSAAAFATWQASEGFTDKAVVPTRGDRPTVGHGSTIYEDGTPVKMGDTITRQRAVQLARNLLKKDEQRFAASLLPTTRLTQDEYDVYIDFIGQYGIGNWRASSMRRHLIADEPRKACNALLRYRFAAKYDCSTLVNGRPNKRCWGVWARQLERHKKCVGAL